MDSPRDSSAYLPLSAKLTKTKSELSERSQQLKDVKNQNKVLVLEAKAAQEKKTQRRLEHESKFRKFSSDTSKLNFPELQAQYQDLLNCYQHLSVHNLELEESLRLEILNNEELRTYMKVLKQQTEPFSSMEGQLSFLKRIQRLASAANQTQKAALVEFNIEAVDVEYQIARLAKSEADFKALSENLTREVSEITNVRDSLRSQLEGIRGELHRVRARLNTTEAEKANSQKENAELRDYIMKLEDDLRTRATVAEHQHIKQEARRLDVEKKETQERLGKEKDEILETLREREVVINDLTKENARIHQDIEGKSQTISQLNNDTAVKTIELEKLKAANEKLKTSIDVLSKSLEREQIKVDQLEAELRDKERKGEELSAKNSHLKEQLEIGNLVNEKLREREHLMSNIGRLKGDVSIISEQVDDRRYASERRKMEPSPLPTESGEVERLAIENKGLQKKVQILAARVGDLKDLEKINEEVVSYLKKIEEEVIRLLNNGINNAERRRGEDGVGHKDSRKTAAESLYRRIMDVIRRVDEHSKRSEVENSKRRSHGDQSFSGREPNIDNLRAEVDKLKAKAKNQHNEIIVLTESQGGLTKK